MLTGAPGVMGIVGSFQLPPPTLPPHPGRIKNAPIINMHKKLAFTVSNALMPFLLFCLD
jgi:hypothetical protein